MFSVNCPCGIEVAVSASQAGTEIPCRCGQVIRVPRLSELQKLAGMPASRVNSIELIRAMLSARKLPSSVFCAYSGVATNDIAQFAITCDVPSHETAHKTWWLASLDILFGFVTPIRPSWIAAAANATNVKMVKQTILHIPLRVDQQYLNELRLLDSLKLQQLLRSEAVYGRLFDEYPYFDVVLP